MAEGARLESVFTGNRNVGSNPTPSAIAPSILFFQQEQHGDDEPSGFGRGSWLQK